MEPVKYPPLLPAYPDDGPTIARPSPGRFVVVEERDATESIKAALRALAAMPAADDGKQRVVVIDSTRPDFASLNFDAVAAVLADSRILALTDNEARRAGLHPADGDALRTLRRSGVLVGDVPTSDIVLAARDRVEVAARTRAFGARAPDEAVPAKTLRRRQRLAARAGA